MSTVVALDIGSSAIAGVEMKLSRDRVTLTKAAVEPIPAGLVHDGEIVQPDALAAELRRIWRAAKFSGKRVRLGVANQRVVFRLMELPALDDPKEMRAAVEFEAAEKLPIPSDQAVVDFQPVMRFDDEDGPRDRVVVVAAHRSMVDDRVGVARRAGLRPTGMDLEAFALLRALLPPPSVVDEGSRDLPAQVVVHVGAEITNLIVSVEQKCLFTRLVGFGGNNMTRAVSDRTGLPIPEAEAVKQACGLLGEPLEGWDPDTVAEVRHALALSCRPLVREVQRSIDYFRGQAFARPIDRIVLAGGSSLCTGLDRYMRQALGIPVEIGNPMRHVDAGIPVDADVAARSAVAVGLALDEAGVR